MVEEFQQRKGAPVDLLVLGGCFGIALIALILLVVVLRGETRTAPHATEVTPKRASAPQQTSGQLRIAAAQIPITDAGAPLTAEIEDPAPPREHEQLQEVADELYTLRQQAREFEERLGVLTRAIERAARTRDTHSPERGEDHPTHSS